MNSIAHAFSPELAILLAGAVLGGVMQGITGFAFGMVAMSVWAWGIDPLDAVVLAVFGGLCGQVLSALTIRRRATAPELLPFLIGGLAGVPVGTYLLPYIGAVQFKLLLGAVLAVGCPIMLATPGARFAGSLGPTGDAAAGVVGGIVGGISGLTGVAPAIWCTIRGFDKARQRELLQNFNMAILTATLVALTSKGVVTTDMLPRLGMVAFFLLVPSIAGARIYRRLPEARFRQVVLILLTVSGIGLLASGIALAAGAA